MSHMRPSLLGRLHSHPFVRIKTVHTSLQISIGTNRLPGYFSKVRKRILLLLSSPDNQRSLLIASFHENQSKEWFVCLRRAPTHPLQKRIVFLVDFFHSSRLSLHALLCCYQDLQINVPYPIVSQHPQCRKEKNTPQSPTNAVVRWCDLLCL